MRLHHFGLSSDQRLWGQTVEVLLEDQAVRVEPDEHLLVSSPCRITAVDGTGRQPYHRVQMVQLRLWALELVRTVWRMPAYRRAPRPRTALHAPQVGLFDQFAT
jgi:hypothetical protein